MATPGAIGMQFCPICGQLTDESTQCACKLSVVETKEDKVAKVKASAPPAQNPWGEKGEPKSSASGVVVSEKGSFGKGGIKPFERKDQNSSVNAPLAGHAVPTTDGKRFCFQCGNEVLSDQQFCGVCGTHCPTQTHANPTNTVFPADSKVDEDAYKQIHVAHAPQFVPFGRSHASSSYSSSGNPGSHGSSGHHGHGSGAHGGRGAHGMPGANAQDIFLNIGTQGNQVLISGQAGHRQVQDQYMLAGSTAIGLTARGGNGGNGGRGGDGARGYRGRDGSNATRSSRGGNGGPGGPGGNGGPGGDGGSSGNGGNIVLALRPEDMDQLMLFEHVDISSGTPGSGGAGGSGGPGGSGGRGGSSYSWTTHSKDSKGNRRTHHHHNPGGHSGPSGPSGRSGSRGTSGSRGMDGSFRVDIDQVGSFNQIYQVCCEEATLLADVKDGVFEPGEWVTVSFTAANRSNMPSPFHQRIYVSIDNERWVVFKQDTAAIINKSLAPNGGAFLYDKLRFQLPKLLRHQVPIGAHLNDWGRMHLRATVERVNKEFPEFHGVEKFNVQFPANMTAFSGDSVVSMTEEAVFLFAVRNIGGLPLGSQSETMRKLMGSITINIDDSDVDYRQVQFIVPADYGRETIAGITYNIDNLMGNSFYIVGGTCQFLATPEKPILPYQRLKLVAELDLGELDNIVSAVPIQKTLFEVQMADLYQYRQGAQYLFITHNRTNRDELNSWRATVGQLGSFSCEWNFNLYEGLNMFQILASGRRLIDDFANQTIVIFNNEYEHAPGDMRTVLGSIDPRQIFRAINEYNVRFYIVGETRGINMEHLCMSGSAEHVYALQNEQKINTVSAPQTFTIEESFGCCSAISLDFAVKKARKFVTDAYRRDPTRKWYGVLDYEAKLLNEGCCSKEYKVGTFVMHQGFATNEPHIIVYQQPGGDNAQYNFLSRRLYHLARLVPFAHKLRLFSQSVGENAAVLRQAILADLVDEQMPWRCFGWSGPIDKSHIRSGLTKLKYLLDENVIGSFIDAKNGDRAKELIEELARLGHYVDAAASCCCDYMWFNRLRRMTTQATESLLSDILDKLPDEYEDHYDTQLSAIRNASKARGDELSSIEAAYRFPRRGIDEDVTALQQDNRFAFTEYPEGGIQSIGGWRYDTHILEHKGYLGFQQVLDRTFGGFRVDETLNIFNTHEDRMKTMSRRVNEVVARNGLTPISQDQFLKSNWYLPRVEDHDSKGALAAMS